MHATVSFTLTYITFEMVELSLLSYSALYPIIKILQGKFVEGKVLIIFTTSVRLRYDWAVRRRFQR